MTKSIQLMALYDEIEPVVNVLDSLRDQDVADDDITVISGIPLSPEMLGRPTPSGRVPLIGLLGAGVGLSMATFFNVGTPLLYSIRVGGQPLIPIPTSAVLTFELTMLGLLVGTFLGVMWIIRLPPSRLRPYDPRIADGRIAILLRCTANQAEQCHKLMLSRGAEDVFEPQGEML